MLGFSSKFRLKSADVKTTFAGSLKLSGKCFVVLYRRTECEHARLGIVLTKQKIKRAVDRNMTKRVVRESFRHQHAWLKGVDIIVLKRSECTPVDQQTLRSDLDIIWRRLAKVLHSA